MECLATCRICGEKIVCKEGTFALGEHLLQKHPDLNIAHYIIENGENCYQTKSKQSKFSFANSLCAKSASIVNKVKKTHEKSPSRSVYKTTIESWRPGTSPLTCPKCGNKDQPYIRKQKNKVAYNPLGAFFLIGCWPLCFLPMLMSGSTSTIACCRKCGFCFGTYDKDKGKLVPPEQDVKVEPPKDLC